MSQTNKVFKELKTNTQDINARLEQLEAREYTLIKPLNPGAQLLAAVTFTAATLYTSVDVTAALGLPAYTRGIIGSFWINPVNGPSTVYFAPSGTIPAVGTQLYYWYSVGADTEHEPLTQTMLLFLGTDGKFNALASATVATYLNVFAYWL